MKLSIIFVSLIILSNLIYANINFTNETDIRYFVSDKVSMQEEAEVFEIKENKFYSNDLNFVLGFLVVIILIIGVIYFTHKMNLHRSN